MLEGTGMEAAQIISPSPRARNLFNSMVIEAKNYESSTVIHLPIEKTLELAVTRIENGSRDTSEVNELVREGWIRPHPDGGWLLS